MVTLPDYPLVFLLLLIIPLIVILILSSNYSKIFDIVICQFSIKKLYYWLMPIISIDTSFPNLLSNSSEKIINIYLLVFNCSEGTIIALYIDTIDSFLG